MLLAAVSTLYGALWMYGVRLPNTQVELGFNFQHAESYNETTHSILVHDVVKDSPAEKYGLLPGDHIIAVNGRMLTTADPYNEAYALARPGDSVEFAVARPGESTLVNFRGIFRARPSVRAQESLAKDSAQRLISMFPALFLLVGFLVLFLKLDDPHAWLLALMFCAFAAAPEIPVPLVLDPSLRAFAFIYRAVFNGMLASLFYLFFAVFPVRSPLERRLPWLKWVVLALGAMMVAPALRTGRTQFPELLNRLIGERAANFHFIATRYAIFCLGLVSLAQNAFLAAIPAEARRRSRVIFWGTWWEFYP